MLEVLGIIFLVILTGLSLFCLWISVCMRHTMRKSGLIAALDSVMERSEAPQLEALESPQWHNPESALELCQQFSELNVEFIGDFTVPAAEDARVRGYHCSSPPGFVTVMDHPRAGCWSNFVLILDDLRTLTISSLPEIGRGAPRPEAHAIEFVEQGIDATTLLGFARSMAMTAEPLSVHSDEFEEWFNEVSMSCHHHTTTAAVNQAWLDDIARDADVKLNGDEAQLLNGLRYFDICKACLTSYAASSGMSALQWEQTRDQLVVVFDDVPGDKLLDSFRDSIEVPEQIASQLADAVKSNLPGREIAQRCNNLLPEEMALVRLASIESPVPADIYCAQSQQFSEAA